MRADRVLEVAGVAHERPARAVRPADVAALARATCARPAGRVARSQPFGELGRVLGDDVADHARRRPRPMRSGVRAREHARLAVVGRDHARSTRSGGRSTRSRRSSSPDQYAYVVARGVDARRGRTARRRAGRPSSGCRRRRSPAGRRGRPTRPSAVVACTPNTRPSRMIRSVTDVRWCTSAPAVDGGLHEQRVEHASGAARTARRHRATA